MTESLPEAVAAWSSRRMPGIRIHSCAVGKVDTTTTPHTITLRDGRRAPLLRTGEPVAVGDVVDVLSVGTTAIALGRHQTAEPFQEWTPELIALTTDPDLGSGATQLGKITVAGNKVDIWFDIVFGSSGVSAGAGLYYIPLPAGLPLHADFAGSDLSIGTARVLDDSTGTYHADGVHLDAPNDRIWMSGSHGNVAATGPWTWAAGDSIRGHASYVTDFG